MGDHFSFCSKQQGRLTLVKMLRFVVLALAAMAAAALGAPGGGHYEYGYNQKHCHTKYNVKYDQQCHEEYDTIVDTTYTEECQDIVTQHCNSVSKQVHHSSAVVGHDTHVVAHGHGYGKREAEADAEAGHHGYSSGPQCQQHVEKKCQKVPQQHSRKVARPVCKTVVDTTYVEECENTFTTECTQTHTQVHHSAAVVGHDTQVVAGG